MCASTTHRGEKNPEQTVRGETPELVAAGPDETVRLYVGCSSQEVDDLRLAATHYGELSHYCLIRLQHNYTLSKFATTILLIMVINSKDIIDSFSIVITKLISARYLAITVFFSLPALVCKQDRRPIF